MSLWEFVRQEYRFLGDPRLECRWLVSGPVGVEFATAESQVEELKVEKQQVEG